MTLLLSFDSAINTPIVTDCVGLVHFDAEKKPDVDVNLIRFGPCCTKNDIIVELGELLAVDTSRCGLCTLTVNTTRQNKIRLDIDNIDALSQFYITYDGIGTRFTRESWLTEDLSSCSITFPTNALAIHSNVSAFYRISTESLNQVSHSNTTIVTGCPEGIVHFEAVDFNIDCSDPTCIKSNIITGNGEILQVDNRWCGKCMLSANTRQNNIRLDIDNIRSLSQYYQSYTLHDGVGTVFTEDLTSCYIIFPTNGLEIYTEPYTRFTIRTEVTNPDNHDSVSNTTVATDCVGLVHFNAVKEPDVNNDLTCSDSRCTRNNIITEIGELLIVDISRCGPCTLTLNTTRQNRIRLDIFSLARPYQSYTVHDDVGTVFTEDLTSCYKHSLLMSWRFI